MASEEVDRLREALRIILARLDPDGENPRFTHARQVLFHTASPPRHPPPEGRGTPGALAPAPCPACGEAELRHVQDVEEVRIVEGFDEQGALVIRAASTVVDEVASDERLWCAACHREAVLPRKVEYK